MRSLFILLLTMIFLGQTFRQPMIFVSYQMNKESIIKTLCINKNKPELKCQGKCHLKKKLKEASEEERSEKQNTVEKVDLIVSTEVRKFIFESEGEELFISYSGELKFLPAIPLYRPPVG